MALYSRAHASRAAVPAVQSAFGTPYKVVRIPMPPQFGDYPDNGGDYRTYANAVFVNKTVLLPIYEEQYDTTALRIWRESLPGYNVVGIECNDIIGLSGAIHCITKEIGVNDPLRIVHKPVEKVFVGEFNPWQCPIIAEAQHRSGVASVSLHYRRETETEWHIVDLTQVNNPDSLDFWAGDIPDQPGYVGHMQYYLDAVANNGKTIARPMPGPEAVGTTALRLIETAAQDGTIAPWRGPTDIFIYPGFTFRVTDALMTNFHLPKSTLLMLVSALMGKARMDRIYAHAIAEGYRFFSYGDASLLIP